MTQVPNSLNTVESSVPQDKDKYDYQELDTVPVFPSSLGTVVLIATPSPRDAGESITITGDPSLPSMNVVIGPADLAERSDDIL